jgi:hypothetical protein
MSKAIKISKLIDKYLPSNGVGTEREQIRTEMHNDIAMLVKNLTSSSFPSDKEVNAELKKIGIPIDHEHAMYFRDGVKWSCTYLQSKRTFCPKCGRDDKYGIGNFQWQCICGNIWAK